MHKPPFFSLILFVTCFLFSCNNTPKHYSSNSIDSTNNNGVVATEDKKYQYILHPAAGKKYYYIISTQTSTKIEVADKEITSGNRSQIGIVYELVKDSGGNMQIKLTYNKIHIVLQKNEEEEQVIDSDVAENEQTTVEKLLSTIKGSVITLTVNTKGDIISSSGSAAISDKIMASMVTEEPKMKQLVQQLVSKLTGDGFIQDNLKEGFKILPDTGVYIGDSWKKKVTQSAEINVEAASTYTLASVNNNIATIEVEGQIISGKNAPLNIMGQQVTTNLSGEQTGRFKTDITTGMLQFGKTNTSIKGTIQVQGREVPVTISIKKEIAVNK